MGNKIEKLDDICCYKNIEHQNMDRVNGVTYINPSQPQFLKIPSINTNINSNILNTNVKQKIEKTIQDNQKITNHSTAMVSKKNSNNNLKSLNLDKNPDDKYFEKEIVINKEALNESINHIQKIFQNNLIEKKSNISLKEYVVTTLKY